MFSESTLEALRTVDFDKEKVKDHFANSYAVRVVNAAGDDVTAGVTGTVTFLAYTTGAGKPQSPEFDIDLSSNDWAFKPFFSYISKAVFSVSGLSAGHRVIVTCLRMDAQ